MFLRFVAIGVLAVVVDAAHAGGPGPGPTGAIVLAQATGTPTVRPPTAAKSAPQRKNCRREPIWGFRMSAFCKPTGICSDRVIKGYRTVCS